LDYRVNYFDKKNVNKADGCKETVPYLMSSLALTAMTSIFSLFTNPQLLVNLTSTNAQGCPRGGWQS
jgi:hypothetical protein